MALNDTQGAIRIRFGGGLNTQTSESVLDPNECADGQNFDLDLDNDRFSRRLPFDKVAEAPNGSPIYGAVQLLTSTGTRSVLIQAGDKLYEWDGTSGTGGMTFVDNVSSGARLRGTFASNSPKDDFVLVADLGLQEKVKTWNGTSWADLGHDLVGAFKARYILVDLDRAFFANVEDNGSAFPHFLIASAVEDPTDLSNSDRPSSGLGIGAAFYLVTPNLAPIRGLFMAFDKLVIPSRKGPIYKLLGTNSQDHILALMHGSSVSDSSEPVVFTGNDIVYGRDGAIDSLAATEKFGDVQSDDLSRWIRPTVKNVTDWTLVYSPRFQKVFCIPGGGGEMYVLHKSIIDERIRQVFSGEGGSDRKRQRSPWSIWRTDDAFNFQPTMAMPLIHPSEGLEYMFMGGSDGSLYRLESNAGGDGASGSALKAERLSRVYELPPGHVFDLNGWVKYSRRFSGTLTLNFEHGGEQLFDQSVTVTMDAATNAPVFGGAFYFGGTNYFGTSFNGRLARKKFPSPGVSEQFQVRATVTGTSDFFIDEIGIQLKQSKGSSP